MIHKYSMELFILHNKVYGLIYLLSHWSLVPYSYLIRLVKALKGN
jgi:hypothetical protein